MEQFSVLHDFAHKSDLHGLSRFLRRFVADFGDKARQINAPGANILAGFAAYAVLSQNGSLIFAVEEIGKDKTDGADVDMSHFMAADHSEHGADVCAGTAAHTAEHLFEKRVLGNFRSAVIQKDDVQFFFVFIVNSAFPGTVDEGDIGSYALTRGVSR